MNRPPAPLVALVALALAALPHAGAQDGVESQPAGKLVEVTVEPQTLVLAPGAQVPVEVTLESLTGRDLTVSVEGGTGPSIPSGWQITPGAQKGRLPAGGTLTLPFTVSAPADAGGGGETGLLFLARDSESDAPVGEGRSKALVLTLDLEATPRVFMVEPGDGGTIHLSARNPTSHRIRALLETRTENPDHWILEAYNDAAQTWEPGDTLTWEVRFRSASDSPRGSSTTFGFALVPERGAGAYASTTATAGIPAEARPAEPEPATPDPTRPRPTLASDPLPVEIVRAGMEPLSLSQGGEASTTFRVTHRGTERLDVAFRSRIDGFPRFEVRTNPPEATLAPGDTLEVRVDVRAPAGAPSTERFRGLFQVVDPATDQARDDAFPVIVEPPAPEAVTWTSMAARFARAHPVAVAGATATAGVSALGAALWRLRREDLQYFGLAPLLGLFTRLAKPDVLNHKTRDEIHKAVQEQPGITFSALKRRFELNTGALVHHLRTLEQHQFVTSRREGAYRRFYPVGERLPAPKDESLTPMQGRILHLLAEEGPVPQQVIAERLGLTRQGANYHVKTLQRKGRLTFEHRDGQWVCTPVESVASGASSADPDDLDRARA